MQSISHKFVCAPIAIHHVPLQVMDEFTDAPALSLEHVRFRRRIQLKTFLKAAGAWSTAFGRQLPSWTYEGVHCFTDTDGHRCMVYNCYDLDKVVAARQLVQRPHVIVELYKGPGDSTGAVRVDGRSVHRRKIMIFRCV